MKLLLAIFSILLLQAAKAPTTMGTVVDAKTQTPLPFARVLFVKIDGPLAGSFVVEADGKGQFSAATVPAGTYRVIAEHDDHLRGTYTAPVSIAEGKASERITIALTPTIVLAGRVFTEHDLPAAKVYVRAHRVSDGVVVADTVAESRTSDLGEFRLFGLAPGSYGLSAEPYTAPSISTATIVRSPGAPGSDLPRYNVPTPPCPDCRGEGQSMQALSQLLTAGAFIDPLALTGQSFPRVYFPGTIELAQAKVIAAEPGARIDGLDIRLVLAERRR